MLPASATTSQVGGDIDGQAVGDWLGYNVSLSNDGSRVAVGAPQVDGTESKAGYVRVYDLVGGSWSQVGADINGEAAGDQSGYWVSLSSDGSRVAIGAPQNDGNGSGAGHVRVYDLVGGSWSQVGADIDGEAAGDLSGRAVSLSSDGSRLAIGASGSDGNGSGAGHVRVAGLVDGSWSQVGADIDGEAAGGVSGVSVSLSSDGSRVRSEPRRTTGTGRVLVMFGFMTWLVVRGLRSVLTLTAKPQVTNLATEWRCPPTPRASQLGLLSTTGTGQTQVMFGFMTWLMVRGLRSVLTLTARLQATFQGAQSRSRRGAVGLLSVRT